MADEQSRGERPGFGPSGPFSTSDIHTVFTAVDIHKNLGQLEKAVKVLERVTDAQGEKIYQVTRQMDRMEHTQTILDEGRALQGQRIRYLERVAHIAETVAAILLALIVYLFHLLPTAPATPPAH
jgi:hypothetical protein